VSGPGEPGDTIVVTTEAATARSLSLFIDPSSAQLLEGGSMDYVEALSGAGFKFHAPRAHALRPAPPAPPSGPAPDPAKPTGPQAERVQEILDTLVNPGVASHGGWVGLVDVKDDVVYLRLGGGCHGCGQVNVTLKQGIEVMIKERMPEIRAVYDTTDHAEGKNPYYAPARH
jgi:Fe/S biogenesis protein NfuA